MQRYRVGLMIVLTILFLFVGATSDARELSIDQRVRAQRIIEQTYYSHQFGATTPFADAVPDSVIEQKVRETLALSAALEKVWNVPLTSPMLEQELRRMAAGTRSPTRLEEIFDALGRDAFLIQECFVRAQLVERLARQYFTDDMQIHSAELESAQRERTHLLESGTELKRPHPHQLLVTHTPDGDNDSYNRERSLAPSMPGAVGPITAESQEFVFRTVIDGDGVRPSVLVYRYPKKDWDSWWTDAARTFSPFAVLSVARADAELPPIAGNGGPACDGQSWKADVLVDTPTRRRSHTAIWTGSEMIVWSGRTVGDDSSNTGSRYNPITDSWSDISSLGAPSGRSDHAAVWTGSEMIVWGGADDGGQSATGGRYNPLTDSWTPTSTIGAPLPRRNFTGVWTGQRALFWGGWRFNTTPCDCCTDGTQMGCENAQCELDVCDIDPFCCDVEWDSLCADIAVTDCECCASGSAHTNSGGSYDPQTDSWEPITQSNAPTARDDHTAVWSGDAMIVWGGSNDSAVNSGGRYDPILDQWTDTSLAGSPTARQRHAAIWSGTEMIVWGGQGAGQSGARYSPASNSWTPTSLVNAPPASSGPRLLWTGNEMLAWNSDGTSQGHRYQPATDSWSAMSAAGAPSPRGSHSLLWTGSEAIVWGGGFGSHVLNTGGRYDPQTDSWTTTFSPNQPQNRDVHTAVWTGNEMIVWGGIEPIEEGFFGRVDGGSYDPMTDSWSATSSIGAPSGRARHTAVWTGSEMIIWGGDGEDFFPVATGARYEPISDTWLPTSAVGVFPHDAHTAVWTGNSMIICCTGPDVGREYFPATDQWFPLSASGAPTARQNHSAVWTGNSMIVWGGDSGIEQLNSGAIYRPATNSWTPTALAGAPEARQAHTAVWTGSEMLVWGNYFSSSPTEGARYNPATSLWSPIATDNAPAATSWLTSVWAGSHLIVWGGDPATQTGGIYDPLTDQWTATTTSGAPGARQSHSAVWTGDEMIVWGGSAQGVGRFGDGGIFDLDGADVDGDGLGCEFDCNDADPGALSFPIEITGLHFPTGTKLRWPSSSGVSGSATSYDVVRGVAHELPVGTGVSEGCVLSDHMPAGGGLGNNTVEYLDTTEPSSGSAFYYLVRAVNSCGQGDYGASSAGVPRSTNACP